jgi:hypothetical protein
MNSIVPTRNICLNSKFPPTLHSTLEISRVQMKSWAGKALETVNCCTFLKRRLIGIYSNVLH